MRWKYVGLGTSGSTCAPHREDQQCQILQSTDPARASYFGRLRVLLHRLCLRKRMAIALFILSIVYVFSHPWCYLVRGLYGRHNTHGSRQDLYKRAFLMRRSKLGRDSAREGGSRRVSKATSGWADSCGPGQSRCFLVQLITAHLLPAQQIGVWKGSGSFDRFRYVILSIGLRFRSWTPFSFPSLLTCMSTRAWKRKNGYGLGLVSLLFSLLILRFFIFFNSQVIRVIQKRLWVLEDRGCMVN